MSHRESLFLPQHLRPTGGLPAVAMRCVLALAMCCFSGLGPNLARTFFEESELLVEECEVSQEGALSLVETRAERRRSWLTVRLPATTASGQRRVKADAQTPGASSGHFLSNGLCAPLRC